VSHRKVRYGYFEMLFQKWRFISPADVAGNEKPHDVRDVERVGAR
jgi:hypothetical protein